MKKETWKIGSIAECEDCGWKYDKYRNAQAVGANHAKHYHHKVRVETTLISIYDGRTSEENGDKKDA